MLASRGSTNSGRSRAPDEAIGGPGGNLDTMVAAASSLVGPAPPNPQWTPSLNCLGDFGYGYMTFLKGRFDGVKCRPYDNDYCPLGQGHIPGKVGCFDMTASVDSLSLTPGAALQAIGQRSVSGGIGGVTRQARTVTTTTGTTDYPVSMWGQPLSGVAPPPFSSPGLYRGSAGVAAPNIPGNALIDTAQGQEIPYNSLDVGHGNVSFMLGLTGSPLVTTDLQKAMPGVHFGSYQLSTDFFMDRYFNQLVKLWTSPPGTPTGALMNVVLQNMVTKNMLFSNTGIMPSFFGPNDSGYILVALVDPFVRYTQQSVCHVAKPGVTTVDCVGGLRDEALCVQSGGVWQVASLTCKH